MVDRPYLESLFYGWFPLLLVLLNTFVALKFWLLGLRRGYQYFVLFLIFSALQSLGMFFVAPRTFAFGLLYFGTMPFGWFFQMAIVLELFRGVLANHPGLRTASRKFILFSFLGSLFCSAGSLFLTPLASEREILFQFLIVSDRVWQSTTTFFLILLTSFLAFFPVPVSRNRRLHTTFLFVFFLTRTLALILITTQAVADILFINLVASTVELACLSGWLVLVTRSGEKTFSRSNWITGGTEQEEKLIVQLEELNSRLLGSAQHSLHRTDLRK